MVALPVADPDSFLPDISIMFSPSFRPILVVTTPSLLKLKLDMPVPFTLIVTSCQAFTFSVCTLILKTLFLTVTWEEGFINFITGWGVLAAILYDMFTLSISFPEPFLAVTSRVFGPLLRDILADTIPEPWM